MIMSASALFFTLFNFSAKNVNVSKDSLFQSPFHYFSLRRSRTVINGLGFPSVRTKTKLSYSYFYSSSRIGSSITDSSSRPYYLRNFVLYSRSSSVTRRLLSATSSTYSYENEAVYNVLQQSVDILQGNNVPEPTLSSCHLLSCALNLPPSNGFSYLLQILEQADAGNTINNNQHLAQRRVTQEEARKFQQMLLRRFHHEPIQYILGEWDFYDFTLKCRAPILCPRPETEELVEWVSQCIIRFQNQQTKKTVDEEAPPAPSRKLRILDVGCGTGAIGLALARLLPESDVVAIDTSQDAVNLSMENYASLNIENSSSMRYQAICCSAKDFTNRRMVDDRGESAQFYFEFDVVVSNPPYIPAADMLTLTRDVLQYESYEALYGGSNDGMGVIRDIIERMPEWTNNSQHGMRELFMEVDTSHPPKIAKWLNRSRNDISSSTLPAFFVESRKDFYGKDRFVRLQANLLP